jgi:HAMP domain-containing protein
MNAEPTTTLYVVNMLYRIEDETTRNDVSARVASKLNLSAEQVYKLLSRPPGRMIKPATLERAELIANAFIGVGVPVEVVKADTPNAPVFLETPEPVQETPRAAWDAPVTPPPAPLEMSVPAPLAVAVAAPSTEPIVVQPEVSDAPPVQRRRGSLAAKVLSVTVLPLLIVGLGLIAYLQTQLTQESVRLEKRNAQEVIQVAIGGLGTQTSAADLARVLRSPVAFVRYTDAQGNKTFVARDTANQAAIQSALAQLETAQVQSGGELSEMSVPELPNETFQIHPISILTDTNGVAYAKFADFADTIVPATAKPGGAAVFGFESKGFQLTEQLVNTVGFIMLAIAIVTLISQVFARQLIDPIVKLTRTADRLSLGELDLPVSAEMGDLAEALERMRLSLKSAIERLRRRR